MKETKAWQYLDNRLLRGSFRLLGMTILRVMMGDGMMGIRSRSRVVGRAEYHLGTIEVHLWE